jgi:hypothetical protein
MFKWFMIIGVAIIAFSVLLQNNIDNIVKPEKDLQPVVVEVNKAEPPKLFQTELPANKPTLTPAEERLKNRVPTQEGTAVEGDVLPM